MMPKGLRLFVTKKDQDYLTRKYPPERMFGEGRCKLVALRGIPVQVVDTFILTRCLCRKPCMMLIDELEIIGEFCRHCGRYRTKEKDPSSILPGFAELLPTNVT